MIGIMKDFLITWSGKKDGYLMRLEFGVRGNPGQCSEPRIGVGPLFGPEFQAHEEAGYLKSM